MLKALLTSTTVQSCKRYKKIWKPKVSKSNVLLFQLAVSVRGIKEKEFGSSDVMFPTPTSQDHSRNTIPPSIGKTRGMDLSMKVVAMYPTPRACDLEGGVVRERTTEKWKLQQSEQKRSSLRSEVEGCSSQSNTSSWWQTQCKLRGVPDGISFELDKDEQTELKHSKLNRSRDRLRNRKSNIISRRYIEHQRQWIFKIMYFTLQLNG